MAAADVSTSYGPRTSSVTTRVAGRAPLSIVDVSRTHGVLASDGPSAVAPGVVEAGAVEAGVVEDGAEQPRAGIGGRVAAPLVFAAAATLVIVARLWGAWLTDRGAVLHLAGGYPLAGRFDPQLTGALLGPVVLAALVVVYGPVTAQRLRWRSLLFVSGGAAAAWASVLAMSAGVSAIGRPLASRYEYPHDVALVTDLARYLDSFVAHVPEGAAGFTWTTHVGGHPPGALLAFVLLDRVGLAGPGWAAGVCIAVGASAVPAVLVTMRVLSGGGTARRAAPFLVLAPAALWVASSADAIFCGVAAWGVAALAVSASRAGRRGDGLAIASGALLGATLMLSYGLVLLGLVAIAAVLVQRRLRPLLVGGIGVMAVPAVAAAAGFSWFAGLAAAADRARAGPAWVDRPAGYFVVAGLAALCIAAGPAALAGVTELIRSVGRGPGDSTGSARRVIEDGLIGRSVVLPTAALLAMAVGLLSTLSKGEVERIYLPFLVWVLPATAAVSPQHTRRWLAASAAVALVVQTSWTLKW